MTYKELRRELDTLNVKIETEQKKLKKEALKEIQTLVKEFGIKKRHVFNTRGKAIKNYKYDKKEA